VLGRFTRQPIFVRLNTIGRLNTLVGTLGRRKLRAKKNLAPISTNAADMTAGKADVAYRDSPVYGNTCSEQRRPIVMREVEMETSRRFHSPLIRPGMERGDRSSTASIARLFPPSPGEDFPIPRSMSVDARAA
jgi:hypothetical protein